MKWGYMFTSRAALTTSSNKIVVSAAAHLYSLVKHIFDFFVYFLWGVPAFWLILTPLEPSLCLSWPPRMIDKSMAGTDVAVLQAVLSARGYYTGALDGVFGDVLDAAVRKFQMDHDLVVDGVCGPMTWRKILEME